MNLNSQRTRFRANKPSTQGSNPGFARKDSSAFRVNFDELSPKQAFDLLWKFKEKQG